MMASDSSGIQLAKRSTALSRKYKHLRRAVGEAELPSQMNLSIEPASGEVWANSEFEFTISFSGLSGRLRCIPFLEVIAVKHACLEDASYGIGPQAAFSYDVLDIGDVFVNSVPKYNDVGKPRRYSHGTPCISETPLDGNSSLLTGLTDGGRVTHD